MRVGYVLYLFVYNLFFVMSDNETCNIQLFCSSTCKQVYLYENPTVVRCSEFPEGAAKTYVTL